MMVRVLSVRVSDFIMATEIPKPTAAASAINWPGSTVPVAGRTITITPITPSNTAAILPNVIRSPRKLAARMAVQIGMVNSIETT